MKHRKNLEDLGFKRAAMKNETATKKLIAAAEAGGQTAVEGFKGSIIVQSAPSYKLIVACVYIVIIHFHHFGLSTISTTSAAKTVELKPNDAVYVKMGKGHGSNALVVGINLEGQDGWRNTKVDGIRLAPLMSSGRMASCR